MVRLKTISLEKINFQNRIALLYSCIFYFIALPVMVLFENGFLYFIGIMSVIAALFAYVNQKQKESVIGTLELEQKELRIYDLSGNLTETIELQHAGEVQYQPAPSNFFKTITYQKTVANLMVHNGKTIRTFPIEVDSQMLENKLKTQLRQEENPITA
jgi:hypothetical protein